MGRFLSTPSCPTCRRANAVRPASARTPGHPAVPSRGDRRIARRDCSSRSISSTLGQSRWRSQSHAASSNCRLDTAPCRSGATPRYISIRVPVGTGHRRADDPRSVSGNNLPLRSPWSSARRKSATGSFHAASARTPPRSPRPRRNRPAYVGRRRARWRSSLQAQREVALEAVVAVAGSRSRTALSNAEEVAGASDSFIRARGAVEPRRHHRAATKRRSCCRKREEDEPPTHGSVDTETRDAASRASARKGRTVEFGDPLGDFRWASSWTAIYRLGAGDV